MTILPVSLVFSEASNVVAHTVSTSAVREERTCTELSTGSLPRMVLAFSYLLPCLMLFSQGTMMLSPILLAWHSGLTKSSLC